MIGPNGIKWLRYVSVHLVPAYEGVGWIVVPTKVPMPVPHGAYGAIFMEYDRPGDPIEPPKVEREEIEGEGI